MFNASLLSISEVERKIFQVELDAEERRKSNRGSHYLLKKFRGLPIEMQATAAYGIKRHFYYCDKGKHPYSVEAIREIIDDTSRGYHTAQENETDILTSRLEDQTAEPNRNYLRLFERVGKSRRIGAMPTLS